MRFCFDLEIGVVRERARNSLHTGAQLMSVILRRTTRFVYLFVDVPFAAFDKITFSCSFFSSSVFALLAY